MRYHPFLVAVIVLGITRIAHTAETQNALTIYSTAQPGAISADAYRPGSRYQNPPGYAMVRQRNNMEIDRGRNALRFTDVAALIDPTTVSFESRTDKAGTRVLEQDFQFDLVDTNKLLQRYLGQPIEVEQFRGEIVDKIEGTLLGTQGGLILQLDDGGVRTFSDYSNIRFPRLPGGLITRPTLVWMVDAKKAGTHDVQISYQTKGMTWWADYNIALRDERRCRLDLSAWVSILNQSGGSFPDSKIKLVAGDVHRAEKPTTKYRMVAKAMPMEAQDGFAEKSFFEYHLYTLQRPSDLPDRSTKQLELFPTVHEIGCKKRLVAQSGFGIGRGSAITSADYGRQDSPKVRVFLEFENDRQSGLGIPMPSGRVRVNKLDPDDGMLEFIGEDTIDHTPKNERIQLELGNAFDVVVERKQTAYQLDKRANRINESFEIKVRNHKQQKVEVVVREALYRWANWKIQQASMKFSKSDARHIEFYPEIPADGEVVITYNVQYDWN